MLTLIATGIGIGLVIAGLTKKKSAEIIDSADIIKKATPSTPIGGSTPKNASSVDTFDWDWEFIYEIFLTNLNGDWNEMTLTVTICIAGLYVFINDLGRDDANTYKKHKNISDKDV